MPLLRNRQVFLARRPNGAPMLEDFEFRDDFVPTPGPGEILLRNMFLSIDPYMRGRMSDGNGLYAHSYALGAPMGGGTVARIVESLNPAFRAGDMVVAGGGWQTFALSDGTGLRTLPSGLEHPSRALGVLGMTGFTAWHGLTKIGARR